MQEGKESVADWSKAEYLRNIISLSLKIPIWWIQKIVFAFTKVKENQIIIYSLKQHGYCCNLKYLTEYLRKKNNQQYSVLWVVKRPEDYDDIQKHGIDVAMLYSVKHWIYRFFSKVVITNDDFYALCLKRKEQIYVNTWHGAINYKKIGYPSLKFANRFQKKIFELNNPQPDIFISGSRAFTESTAYAFGFDQKVFLPSGLPRNDIFFRNTNELKKHVKSKLGIPEETKIVLFAPTFRSSKKRVDLEGYSTELCDCLAKKFGGKWIFLIRQHYFTDRNNSNENGLFDVTGYEDMQELLISADCLISDYSSCMWDYSFTEKPCFCYAPDIKDYEKNDRSFFIEPEEWPYPLSRYYLELKKNITNFDYEKYKQAVIRHHEKMGAYDRGNASEQIMQAIENIKMREI